VTEHADASLRQEGGFSLRKTSADVRILLVDDNEPFRRFVASALRDQPNLHVIGEVGDGFEAVRQAEALQPDLILLDIGLPGLNGIGAARRMGELAPNARIIFLTQESSTDMVREALSLGAWGYLIKVQAGKELLVAVEMVMQGKRFVSSGLDGHENPATA
jgi:DNA-binding NarL/FixJ family response regulator